MPKKRKKAGFFAKHKPLMATSTLIGTIVGAGILGIPYTIAKAGVLYGFILIILLGAAFLLLNLFGGEIALRTKTQHQLTGYAEKYLGKTGKRFMTLAMLINIYGALIAYIIGEGSAIHSILGFGTPLLYSLIFFVIVFFIIHKGVKAAGKAELILISLLLVVVVLIGIFSFNSINLNNLAAFDPTTFLSVLSDVFTGNFSSFKTLVIDNLPVFFLPYGVILFAFMGMPAVPEMHEQLGKEKKKLKKAIITGSIIPIFLYIIFTAIIVGIIGAEGFEMLQPNERIATVALSFYAHPVLGLFANLLAILAMFTSFISLGTALKQVYEYDYHLSPTISLLLTMVVPLAVVLMNLTSFIAVLAVTGALAGGLESTLIILTYWKAKTLGNRKPEYSLPKHTVLGIILIAMFILGILYQFLH